MTSAEITNGRDSHQSSANSNDKIIPEASVAGRNEERLDELRNLFGKAEGDPLRIVGVGAGAWGSVFLAMIQVIVVCINNRLRRLSKSLWTSTRS